MICGSFKSSHRIALHVWVRCCCWCGAWPQGALNEVFAYDASPAADRALERLANSPLFAGLPVTIVMAEASGDAERTKLARAEAAFAPEHSVTAILARGKAEEVIPRIVAATEGALLLMGAYGHSPIRRMILGSTTTEMVRTVKAPVLMVR